MPQSSRRSARNRRPWKNRPTRLQRDLTMMRSISNFVGLPLECRPICRRAGRCAMPGAPCFDTNAQYIIEYLDEVLDWPRFQRQREPHEINARGGDMLD